MGVVADLFFRTGDRTDTSCDDFAFEWHLAHSGSRPCLPFLLTSHHVAAPPHLLQEGGIAARAAEEEEEEEEGEAEGEAEGTEAAAAKEPAAGEERGEKEKGKEGGLRMGGWGARRARAEETDTTMRRTHGSNTSRRRVCET